jgi:hypothetical protein
VPAAKKALAKARPAKDDLSQFPNLLAQREWDRQEHIRRAMAAGMTRKEAERHAAEELGKDEA